MGNSSTSADSILIDRPHRFVLRDEHALLDRLETIGHVVRCEQVNLVNGYSFLENLYECVNGYKSSDN